MHDEYMYPLQSLMMYFLQQEVLLPFISLLKRERLFKQRTNEQKIINLTMPQNIPNIRLLLTHQEQKEEAKQKTIKEYYDVIQLIESITRRI
ncbi:unnamed protein product [Paramecium octaurelia]|uniref:Uncharacterized protein n=1 Tax=Paramecium octaurelia TaxID=43137 RepID=A0A8S1SU21_PAROT|nr:unnamed protein product [Paramecium octaurelia]